MTDSANPRQNVTFDSAGTQAHGYLAAPTSGDGPGVILIQEWWGLDDHMVDVADRLASEGFVVLAPDLYGGRVAHEAQNAMELMRELPAERGVELLAGAVDYLLGRSEVTSSSLGAVGFCMGGGFVLRLAARDQRITAAVPFYGAAPDVDYTGLVAEILGHFGADDASIPVSTLDPLREKIAAQSGVEADLRVYPAGHAFYNSTRPSYHAESAEKAWAATVEFLRAHVS
ncbi:dienelactone hydrolase family protein [Gordonia effusa]|nr:dienelactone hydrolase family protein [Gordonia effusa]